MLLLLIPNPTSSYELGWPYNLPAHIKYYPEDEAIIKKNAAVQWLLEQEPAIGVRKMSGDPGEKFHLDYWAFAQDVRTIYTIDYSTNSSQALQFYGAPLLLHGNHSTSFTLFRRSFFAKRDYQCPAGTSACTSILRPNNCCPSDQICQLITGSQDGDVGCCSPGQVCGGPVRECSGGLKSCPNDPGGGCCIPGYDCYDIGCIQRSTAVVTVQPSTTSTPSSSATPLTSATTTTTTAFGPPIVASTSAPSSPVPPASITQSSSGTDPPRSTSTITTTTTTSATSRRVNTLICSSGFRSCPASLGGGCCPSTRACARDYCPALSSTAPFGAPVRPTSGNGEPNTLVPTTVTSSGTAIGCPTGFYACSAYYEGGCCQIGRDCAKTSCPTAASTLLVNSTGLTIVAPTGSGITAPPRPMTGTCANGWSTCPASESGGCCPSGFACGTATCTATVSGAGNAEIGKVAPSVASTLEFRALCMFSAMVVGALAVLFI